MSQEKSEDFSKDVKKHISELKHAVRETMKDVFFLCPLTRDEAQSARQRVGINTDIYTFEEQGSLSHYIVLNNELRQIGRRDFVSKHRERLLQQPENEPKPSIVQQPQRKVRVQLHHPIDSLQQQRTMDQRHQSLRHPKHYSKDIHQQQQMIKQLQQKVYDIEGQQQQLLKKVEQQEQQARQQELLLTSLLQTGQLTSPGLEPKEQLSNVESVVVDTHKKRSASEMVESDADKADLKRPKPNNESCFGFTMFSQSKDNKSKVVTSQTGLSSNFWDDDHCINFEKFAESLS